MGEDCNRIMENEEITAEHHQMMITAHSMTKEKHRNWLKSVCNSEIVSLTEYLGSMGDP